MAKAPPFAPKGKAPVGKPAKAPAGKAPAKGNPFAKGMPAPFAKKAK